MYIDTVTEVVLDADSGVVLRLRQEKGGRPSRQQVLTGLTTRPQAERAPSSGWKFHRGSRVLRDSGTMFDEAELSAPAQTAVTLTVKAPVGRRQGRRLPGVAARRGQAAGPGQR